MLETNMARWEREWHERSEAHGRAEGALEGQSVLIMLLLEKRFGPLSSSVRNRLAGATQERLLAYATRLIDAPDLESVLCD